MCSCNTFPFALVDGNVERDRIASKLLSWKEAGMSDDSELLEIEVAGTTITVGRNEAALVVYANCQYCGTEVRVSSLSAYIVERKVGDQSVCAAIFPRLQPPGRSLASWDTKMSVFGTSSSKFRQDNDVGLFAGNVTEVYLQER
jgi:hypothetical protein